MKAHSANSAAAIVVAALVAGCAPDGTLSTGLNTSSINQEGTAQVAKGDPACVSLASQIDALNQEGVAEKVSQAAAKKYKMKATDLTKADALNKAHAELQAKCSSYPPSATVAQPAAPAEAAPKVAAKSKPPVPSPKPVAAAMAPQPAPEALGQPAAQP